MIELRPATVRDVSFIGSYMRQQDKSEILGVLPEWMEAGQAAQMCLDVSPDQFCWVATYKGQPACAFGAAPISPYQMWRWSAWSFGTNRMVRAIPAISRFMKETWFDQLFAAGVARLEVYSSAEHDVSHRWLKKLGLIKECTCRMYGREGDDYEQWVLLNTGDH